MKSTVHPKNNHRGDRFFLWHGDGRPWSMLLGELSQRIRPAGDENHRRFIFLQGLIHHMFIQNFPELKGTSAGNNFAENLTEVSGNSLKPSHWCLRNPLEIVLFTLGGLKQSHRCLGKVLGWPSDVGFPWPGLYESQNCLKQKKIGETPNYLVPTLCKIQRANLLCWHFPPKSSY